MRASSPSRSLAARCRPAALAATLTLGLAASPGVLQAALITISTPVTGTQSIPNGDNLAVTASGAIDATASGPGVVAQSSGAVIDGDVTNAGSIGSLGDGIRFSGSITVAGSIENTGTIIANDDSAGAAEGADGIEIDFSSVVEGDITNWGSIDARQEDGIAVTSSSAVFGNITNAADGTITAVDDGIDVAGGSLVGTTGDPASGNIRNAGSITARNGIHVSGSIVYGDVENQAGGTIAASDDGIDVDGFALIGGAVRNAGRIDSGSDGIIVGEFAEVAGEVANAAGAEIVAGEDGIDLSLGAQAGSLTNAGSIEAADSGIEVDSGGLVAGDLTNAAGGTIESGRAGILVSGPSVIEGDLVNAGSITSAGDGIAVAGTASVWGAILNTGSITAEDASILVTPTGLVAGNVSNTGTLTGALAIDGINSTTAADNGIDLINAGIIDIGSSESRVSGDFTQTGSGVFRVTLSPFALYAAAPLTILDDAFIDGILTLTLPSGPLAPGAERFTLFSIGGARSGEFANLAQGALVGTAGRGALFIDYTLEGDIELYYAPTPGTLALFGLGALAGLARRRRSD
jgi:hypothetical protein